MLRVMAATSPTKRGHTLRAVRAQGQRKKDLEKALGIETVANAVANPKGALRWCNRCSRRHRSREICDLYLRESLTAHGKLVKTWAH